MSFAKKHRLTISVLSVSLLIVTASANRVQPPDKSALGIELALQKPFYIPAAVPGKEISAVIRVPLTEEYSEHETVSAVKLVPHMDGTKVKVTVFALIGNAGEITKCSDWDSLKSITVDTYVAGLGEEISISKLGEYGVNFEDGVLKFRVVPRKVFPQWGGIAGGGCGCASCGTLQCCPNPGYCLNCGKCGFVCCNS